MAEGRPYTRWIAGGTLAIAILGALQVQAIDTARSASEAYGTSSKVGDLAEQNTSLIRLMFAQSTEWERRSSDRFAENRERLARVERDIDKILSSLNAISKTSSEEYPPYVPYGESACISIEGGPPVCGRLVPRQQEAEDADPAAKPQ